VPPHGKSIAECEWRSERLVAVGPLREAFVASGLTYGAVCRRIGWMYEPGPYARSRSQYAPAPDTSRLKRALGILPSVGSKRDPRLSVRIDYDIALRIAEAIGADPVDIGL
jgi:hypothetical protein